MVEKTEICMTRITDRKLALISILIFLMGLATITLLSSCVGGLPTSPASAGEPRLLMEEDFTNPESGWEVSTQGGVKEYFNGTYHIQINDPNIFSWSVVRKTYGDVAIEVETAFTGSADLAEMGVVCRMMNSHDFYFLTIRSDGAYGIFKMENGDEHFIGMDGYQISPAINTGVAINLIQAECKGEQISLAVNDTHLITVVDDSYQVGDVGVIAGAFDGPDVNVFYDNFRVTQP
jgi:hypothetical protein